MDFGTLLSVAQKNEHHKTSTACYQTKFTPPKKQNKQSKALSENIKKFLARKEEEERQKALEEKRKKENLLALRDHKAQSRINKHLKVCKAANKSVLADAIDNENTAVTIAGPSQPDEDDYGYVSQEASAFYNQLMNKYNNLPAEKPLFSDSGKKTVKDIASTKDRVRQALKQQEIEESLGHRRKRKTSTANGKEVESESKTEKEVSERNEKTEKTKDADKNEKPKPKKKPAPPPLDFRELLKLAEKKQHEPIVIEPKPKVEEPERLMTKKQMKEYMKEKEWRERKEQRKSQDSKPNEVSKKPSTAGEPTKSPSTPQFTKIPKLGEKTPVKTPVNSLPSKSVSKPVSNPLKKPAEKTAATNERSPVLDKSSSVKKESLNKNDLLHERKKLEEERKQLEEMRRAIEEEKKKLAQSKVKKVEDTKLPQSKPLTKTISKPNGFGKPEIKDVKPKQFPPPDLKPKPTTLTNGAPKQFPPPDVRPLKRKHSEKDLKRPHKRRIFDDDEEYDSELDDFIDDGPQEESEDYSKYISEIFGYDKSKYRYVDDEDDTAMESNFAQQLKEEYVSTKIGIMEDLEDIRKEALEKKRKALMKKKSRK